MDISIQDLNMGARRQTDQQLGQTDASNAALLKHSSSFQRDTRQAGLQTASPRGHGLAKGVVDDKLARHHQNNRQLQQQQQQQQSHQTQHRQLQQLQHQQSVQQPWPRQQVKEVPEQQQQQSQALVGENDRFSALLNDYVPPAACTQLNVPVLMQQTTAAIARWKELQKNLNIRSDEAPANLAAQAQVRLSIKRDLTNLTQLADAQTKHTQRMKMRQVQALAMKVPAHGGFRGGVVGGDGAGAALEPLGSLPCGEAYVEKFQPKSQVPLQQPPGALTAGAAIHGAAAATSSSYTANGRGAMSAVAVHQGIEGGGGGGGGGGDGGGSGLLLPQSQQQNNNRHQGIKQRLDRTEQANKWAVLVEASLRLPSSDGSTFKQFTLMVQNFLNKFNGDIGIEVARALGTCLDPRVFDPMDIKRAQERMAGIYSRFRRSQR